MRDFRQNRWPEVHSARSVSTNDDISADAGVSASLQSEEVRGAAETLAVGRVAGILAHKINNPLQAIMNALFLLRDRPSLDEEGRRYAHVAEEELRWLVHIVRQTLWSSGGRPANRSRRLDRLLMVVGLIAQGRCSHARVLSQMLVGIALYSHRLPELRSEC